MPVVRVSVGVGVRGTGSGSRRGCGPVVLAWIPERLGTE